MAASATSLALATALRLPAVLAGATAAVGMALVLAAMVDVREHRLPNRLLAVAMSAVLFGVLLSWNLTIVRDALVSLVLGGGLMLLVRVTRGVGMGDVKAACVVGASVGIGTGSLRAAPVAVAIAAFAAAVFGLVTDRRRLALGPSLWFGWAATLTLAVAMPSSGWLP